MIDVVYNDEIFGYLNFYINYQFFYVNYDSAFIMIQFNHFIIDENFIKILEKIRKVYSKNLHYFIHSWAHLDGTHQYDILKLYCDSVTILANTFKEHYIFKSKNYKSLYCNHNCWLDENVFKPLPNIEKRYDFVYNANNCLYKNHKLLKNIIKNYNSLFITYDGTMPESNTEGIVNEFIDTENIRNKYKPTSTITTWDTNHVCELLNSAKVGIYLTTNDGACYASSEYLLCGLPVVSTKSTGGRDVWYNEDNSIIIDFDEKSLHDSIQYFLNNYHNIDHSKIRNNHIIKQKSFKKIFINYVKTIFDSCEIKDDIEESFIKNYKNKMLNINSFV
jgi:glycosyltransferase involved in cell wall biosynthesis